MLMFYLHRINCNTLTHLKLIYELPSHLTISKFLSSILRVDVLSCVCVPCTVKFPNTVTSSLFNVIDALNDDVNVFNESTLMSEDERTSF